MLILFKLLCKQVSNKAIETPSIIAFLWRPDKTPWEQKRWTCLEPWETMRNTWVRQECRVEELIHNQTLQNHIIGCSRYRNLMYHVHKQTINWGLSLHCSTLIDHLREWKFKISYPSWKYSHAAMHTGCYCEPRWRECVEGGSQAVCREDERRTEEVDYEGSREDPLCQRKLWWPQWSCWVRFLL